MKDENVPFDGSKLAPELRVGLADAKGNLIALPVGLSTPILFINKAAFRKAGLDPEKPPKTWAEMQVAADKLFDAGSTCPYTTSWPAWVHIDNLSSWNGVEVADAKGKLNFNGLVQVKHTAMLTTWAKGQVLRLFRSSRRGRQPLRRRRVRHADQFVFALAARCAIAARWRSVFRRCRITTMCRARRSRRWPVGYSLWVGAGQKPAEYKGVAQFVSFLLEPDLQVEFTAASGFLPMTSAARAAAGSKLLKADVAGLNVAYAQLQGPGALRTLRVSEIEKVRIIVEEELEAAWSGKTPAKQALDIAVERGNVILHAAPGGSSEGTKPAPKK
jgi:sn-glycerol 3-phosphate transport system substrate-binding protein